MIKWTQTASNDLRRIINFIISRENKAVGKKIFNRIKKRVAILNNMPAQGRIVPELSDVNIHLYRELIESPWRIIYRLDHHIVYIEAVIDGRRSVDDILLDRYLDSRGK